MSFEALRCEPQDRAEGPDSCNASPGTVQRRSGRGDTALISKSERNPSQMAVSVQNTLGYTRRVNWGLSSFCLILWHRNIQAAFISSFPPSKERRKMEDGSTLTSENVFSNERAVYLTRVSACHSSAQITGSAFDVFSPLRMTASSVRQTEKWEMWQLLFPSGLWNQLVCLPVTVQTRATLP